MLSLRAKSGRSDEDRTTPTEDELVRQHLPLVNYIVSEVASRIPRHVNRDDLVSAGMAGLAQAARSFDAERGISFQRFASARIRGALLDELRSRDWASRSVRSRAREVTQATDRLTASLGRRPSLAEVAEAMGSTQAELQSVEADVHRALVLNFEALPAEGGHEPAGLSALSGPDETVLNNERRAYLVAAVDHLPERLRRVVLGYFFEELPMAELAEELGVTDSRISQMRAEALELLRDAINAQLDPDLVAPDHTGRVAKRRAAYFASVASHDDYRRRLSADAGQLTSLVQPREPVAALA
ncbi:MAG: FliA/WhiG family RNA polymerase sigma factor [Actinomycetota bacterium]|jgi:RNA polymerase sigma factor for flagellar operon FliA|nr:FliA/WhiG family RNA polymerase sigma factor [Actinomycetota bacterium]